MGRLPTAGRGADCTGRTSYGAESMWPTAQDRPQVRREGGLRPRPGGSGAGKGVKDAILGGRLLGSPQPTLGLPSGLGLHACSPQAEAGPVHGDGDAGLAVGPPGACDAQGLRGPAGRGRGRGRLRCWGGAAWLRLRLRLRVGACVPHTPERCSRGAATVHPTPHPEGPAKLSRAEAAPAPGRMVLGASRRRSVSRAGSGGGWRDSPGCL